MAFVLVLSYSRYPFVRFYLGASLANLIRGHVEAFRTLGGTARVLLYDNMKSVVLERAATPSGSIPRCSSSPPTTASNRAPSRLRGEIRRAALKTHPVHSRELLPRPAIPRPRRPQRPGRRVVYHPRRRAPLSRGPTAHRRRRATPEERPHLIALPTIRSRARSESKSMSERLPT